MRRVLHIFSTGAIGGPQRRFADIANRLTGYTHHLCSFDGDMALCDLINPEIDIEIHSVPMRKSRGIDFGNLANVRRLVKSTKPDLICTYNWGAIEAALAVRGSTQPHYHFEDGFGQDETPQRQKFHRVLMRRFALSGRNTTLIVPSHTLQQLAITRWKFRPQKVRTLPNGVDVDRFVMNAPRSMSWTIGTVCALRPEKNLTRLLNILQLLPAQCRLIIAGDGSERASLEQYTEVLGLQDRVRFLGHVSEPEKILGALDLYVVTSDTEQMPLGVLEAMATGLPIVATNVGDIASMVCAENEKYIRSKEEALMAEAILWLMEHEDERNEIGSKNAHRVREFYTIERMIERYQALYDGREGGV